MGNSWAHLDKQAVIDASIGELFEKQVERTPDRLALQTRSLQMNYAELNRAANRVAYSILAEQKVASHPIALHFAQRAPLVAAMLGVLKAGGFFVILDTHATLEYNHHILMDSKAALLCTDQSTDAIGFVSRKDSPCVIRIDPFDPSLPGDNLQTITTPNPIARLSYTSGSTGRPKGTIQTQRHSLHATVNLHTIFRLTAKDKFLYNSATGFTGLIGPLICGASIFPVDLKVEGLSVIRDAIRQAGVTILHTVPTVLRHFLGTLDSAEQLPGPRLIAIMGEPTPREFVELFRWHFPKTAFVNLMGSKETLDYRVFVLDAETQFTGEFLPAGYPLDDKEVLLLDSEGNRLGEGATGEIGVKSRYLSPGYWGNEQLTALRFIQDPAGGDERIYRTGDLGTFLPDGCLMTLGRNDFQVKIRGYQVRIDEVEAALAQVDGVSECAVILNDEHQDNHSLDAYVVVKQPVMTVTVLRAILAKELADYMLPSRFIYVDSLPYTPMGKVNRSLLKTPTISRPKLEMLFTPATTPIEQVLVHLWSTILGLDEIGIHDPFLELGGNSLQAMRIAAQVQDEFGVEIPLAELFAAGTVAEMALVVTACMFHITAPEALAGSAA